MSTSSPLKMAQVLGALDHLDHERQTQADQERAALIQSVTLLCQAQGDDVPDQAIARAVDAQLAQPLTPAVAFDFGWPRPVTKTEQSTQLAEASSARRQRSVGFWRWGDGSLDEFALSATLLGGLFLNVMLLWGLHKAGLSWHPVLAVAALANVGLWSGVRAWARQTRRDFFTAKRLIPWVDTDDHMTVAEAQWLSFPSTRRYLQQCFLSGVPEVMQGDAEALKALLAHDQDVAEQARAQRRHHQTMTRLSAAVFQPDDPAAVPT